MARFLFTVPPLAGHVNPTISVGRELARRGHDVAWAGPGDDLAGLLPGDAELLAAGDPLPPRPPGLRAAAAFKFLWEEIIVPLGHTMTRDLDPLVDRWQPDVLVVDQQAIGGAAVARRRGLLWATSATNTAEMVDPLANVPSAADWVRDQLAEFQRAVGVPEAQAAAGDLRFSEHLVLVFSSRFLVGDRQFSPHVAFVGPSIADRRDAVPFPWDWLDDRVPHVVVSLGTVNARAGERFFLVAAEALADQRLQAVLVAPPDLFGGRSPAANLLVQERVPLLELLGRTDAVVCHGGNNTVCESLAHGIPLVVAPIVDDQPVIANQVVAAGAGLRVHVARVGPGVLRRTVRAVLDEPSFARAAAAARDSFAAAGGAAEAASRLEALVHEHRGAEALG